MKLLFVCRANVGRSQIAEMLFKKIAGEKHQASSAGTWVTTEEKDSEGQYLRDKESAHTALAVLREEGIDASGNQRNQVTPQMVEDADQVILMAEDYSLPDFLRNNDKVIIWDVPDMVEKSLNEVRVLKDDIKQRIIDFIGAHNII